MGIKSWVVVKELSGSVAAIKKSILLVPYPILMDLVFLFSYGFIASFFTNNMLAKLYSMADILMKNPDIPDIYLSSPGLINLITLSPETSGLFKQFLLWALLLAIVTYLMYCIFQSVSWKISLDIAKSSSKVSSKVSSGHDVSFWQYAKRFFIANILWFLIFLVYKIASVLINFRDSLAALDYINLPKSNISIILDISIICIFYFAAVSYCLSDRKKPVSAAFKMIFGNLKQMIPAAMIIALPLVVVDLVLKAAFLVSPRFMAVTGIILAFPAFVWARVYLKMVVDGIEASKSIHVDNIRGEKK